MNLLSSETTIDVQAVVAELRERLARPDQNKGAVVESEALREALHEMELTHVISAHWPIIGHGIVGRTQAFVQKVIRRLLRWYINPIVEQQNAFNAASLRAFSVFVETFYEHAHPNIIQHADTTNKKADMFADALQDQNERARREPPFSPEDTRVQELDHALVTSAQIILLHQLIQDIRKSDQHV